MQKYYNLIKEAEEAYTNGDVLTAVHCYEKAFRKKRMVDDYLRLGFLYKEIHENLQAALVFQNIRNYLHQPDAYLGIAKYYEKIGEREIALSYYLKIVNVFPDFSEGQFLYANLLDEKSKQLADSDNNLIREILKAYRAAIRKKANYGIAILHFSLFLERIKNYQEALECLLKAWETNVAISHINYYIGRLYEKINNQQEALSFYLKEVESSNPINEVYFVIALLYKNYLTDYISSKHYFLLALDHDENNFQAWYQLLIVYVLMNDYDNAHKCYKYLWLKNSDLLDNISLEKGLEDFLLSKNL